MEFDVPAKKTNLPDAERAKRMRALGREAEVDNDPASFDRAFDKVVRSHKPGARGNESVSDHVGQRKPS